MQYKQEKILKPAPEEISQAEREQYLAWLKKQRKDPNSLVSRGERMTESVMKAFGDTDEE